MKSLIFLMAFLCICAAQDQFPEFPIYPDFLFIPETEEAAAYTYQPEALALFARMGDVPESRKQLIDGLIANFKNESLWELGAFWNGMDAIWSFTAHDQTAAPLNWIEDDYNCTEVNSPTFEIDRGYTGNGTTSYLNTDFNPSSDGVNFVLNDASFGIYLRTNSASNTKTEIGVATTGVTSLIIYGKLDSPFEAFNFISCNNAVGLVDLPFASSAGFSSVSRLVAGNFEIYKNGVSLGVSATASSSLPNGIVFIGAYNLTGTGALNFSDRQISFAFIGRGLTANEQTTLFNLVEAYLDAIGAGVVP